MNNIAIEERINFVLSEIDSLFNIHENLLRKDKLSDIEQNRLGMLNDFIDKLPFGKTKNEIDGFAKLREFAEKIGKQKN